MTTNQEARMAMIIFIRSRQIVWKLNAVLGYRPSSPRFSMPRIFPCTPCLLISSPPPPSPPSPRLKYSPVCPSTRSFAAGRRARVCVDLRSPPPPRLVGVAGCVPSRAVVERGAAGEKIWPHKRCFSVRGLSASSRECLFSKFSPLQARALN